MTVADNTSRNQYTATNLQVSFAYTFEIVDKDDIVVLKNGTTLSEGADYLVFNVGNDNGGTIELTAGATAGDILTLYRDMPYARTQNYTNSGDFLASEVNSDFDELWLASEQTNRSFEQSVRKPITDSDTISMELPEASSRANKLLGFDATGAVSTSLVTDDAQTIAGIADDIETLAHIQDGTVATDAITNVNTIRTDVTAVSGVASDVTAVAGNTANINTVATDLTGADDIGTVAGSIANVNTVAGDIANVNSVAGNATNINTVAADLSGADDIGTVAGSISSVNTVAPDINHVVTVSGDLAGADNIGTVATNISNVNAVGGISSDVTTVAGISTEVTAVSSNSANINTVGTNITNVNNVGSNIANVNTVAGLETEINAVVADEADIGVVGANITSVNTVSSNINSVNAVYNNMADVNNAAANATAAAASAADANTSAGAAATSANAASTSASNASSSESAALTSANNASQSAATASLSASAAATSATNASSSAANAATSESNADNSETAAAISASNASSSASTASNNAIAAASSATSASNSASQAASSAAAAATSASNSETAADTWNSYYSTYLGASATAPSYDLLGQPLQNGALYFNTTDDTMYVFNGSIWIAAESTINIVSVPTQLAADLTTNGNDIIFGDNDRAKFGAGSDLEIYHDGSNSYIAESNATGNLFIKGTHIYLQNSAGIDALNLINGNAFLKSGGATKLQTTSTGIDVTGTIKASGNGKLQIADDTEGSTFEFNVGGSGALEIYDGSTERMRINSNGNVGIGTSSPADNLHLFDSTNAGIKFTNTTSGSTASDGFSAGFDNSQTAYFWNYENGGMKFATNNAERVRIDASGNVGIGTTSPNTPLHIANAAPVIRLEDTSASVSHYINSNNTELRVQAASVLSLRTSVGEAMRINSSGNVGIGTSSPAQKLVVDGGSGNSIVRIQGDSVLRVDFGASTDADAGRIEYDSTGNSMRLYTDNSEAMRITSAGNVGIGTTNPQHNLDVVSLSNASASARIEGGSNLDASLSLTESGNSGFKFTYDGGDNKLYIGSGTSGTFNTRISVNRDAADVTIGNGSNNGVLKINGASGSTEALIFQRGGTEASRISHTNSTDLAFSIGSGVSEKMRITSGGHLLVGKTSSNNGSTEGVEIQEDGQIFATKSNDACLYLNRLSGDAALLVFKKAGTTIGQINARSGDLLIGTGDVALRFDDNADAYIPFNITTDVGRDAGIDLGASSARFKDLYLSAQVRAGNGTASAPAHSFFSDSDTGTFRITNNTLGFSTGGSERARIDASGNVMVGKTTTSLGTAGVTMLNTGKSRFTVDGDTAVEVNRLTSDGTLVEFRKNTATVGSIGVVSSDNMYVTSSVSGQSGIGFVTGAITPYDSGTETDNATDLGNSSNRFKDLYLSGGISFNPNAAANKLDDYEEGTFTPTVIGATTAGTATYTTQYGKYTKVGNIVFVQLYVAYSGHTGAGDMQISGLPFTAYSQAGLSIGDAASLTIPTNSTLKAATIFNSTKIRLRTTSVTSGSYSDSNLAIDAGATINLSGVYRIE